MYRFSTPKDNYQHEFRISLYIIYFMQAQNKYERLFKTLSIYFLPFRINSCWLEKINIQCNLL